jgi:hypothetical protein
VRPSQRGPLHYLCRFSQSAALLANDRYLRIPAGWIRREADIVDLGGRRIWTDSAPTLVASGRTGTWAKPTVYCEREVALTAQTGRLTLARVLEAEDDRHTEVCTVQFPSAMPAAGRRDAGGQDASSPSNVLASFRSSVSKPSVNQP